MGGKYEVLYWDWKRGKEVTEEYTNSIFRAIYLLHKLEKEWHCVTIKFRRGKVKEDNKEFINKMPNSDGTVDYVFNNKLLDKILKPFTK